MATYIVGMDPDTHADDTAAKNAITSAGGTVTKTYSFPLTYKIDCTADQLSAMTGVATSEGADAEAVLTPAFNVDHLKILSNDIGTTTANYNPVSTADGEHLYLVDTGINTTHNEFTGATVNNLYTAFGTDFSDTAGHGTAMASLIVGQNIGTAKDATLHNVKVMNSNPYTGTIGAMVDALEEILVHHNANTPAQTKVVVCCWTTGKNQLLDIKLQQLEDNNMIVVCSAGNDANDVDFYSPAGLDQVMTVGGHNASGVVGYFSGGTTNGSNLGPEVDIFGMSDDVSIVNVSNNTDYTTSDGTSVATAQIAGLVAQYIDLYPSADARTIKSYVTAEGSVLGRGGAITFDSGLITDTAQEEYHLQKVIGVSPQIGDLSLAAKPSGIAVYVQSGQSASSNIEINNSASNVSVMSFSPVPPFATFANTGVNIGTIAVDTSSNMEHVTVPGIYHFAVKGEVSGSILVEEYSIGIYNADVSELDSSPEFYYDSDGVGAEAYDQVVNFNATKE